MVSTPLGIQNKLKEVSGREILLMLTNNTHRMLTIKESTQGSIALRAHKMFLHAEEEIITSLGRWLAGDARERQKVREFIINNSHEHVEQAQRLRQTKLTPQGKYFNLDIMAADINKKYLGDRSRAAVTWGRKITKRKASTIRLGWYDPVRNQITLSQRLDRRDIPRYMVEYVLFHEMLHEVIGIGRTASGRRDIHSRKFNLMEQTYPYYNEARAFEKKKWGGI